MQTLLRAKPLVVLVAMIALGAVAASGQGKPAAAPSPAAFAPSGQEIGETQQQFLRLLRNSPTLTTVLAHDPSLLADQAYVTRNNPELERFVTLHPEVAQNPDFYLFSKVGPGNRQQALARQVWPELVPEPRDRRDGLAELADKIVPMVVIPAFFFCIGWMIKLFVDSRRQSRIDKMLGEVHARLIDKFSTSQELIAYMQTEAGRRFLEATPVATGGAHSAPLPNVLNRILTPVQIGVVLSLLGIGMIAIRHASPEGDVGMLIIGTLLLMPGLGFILSAGVTWFLAGKLGLMPGKSADESIAPQSNE
jgi:hypothetical protein